MQFHNIFFSYLVEVGRPDDLMPLNFQVIVGFFRRNHFHAWPFRCRVEPSMKLWCRKGAPQVGQSLQMKAAQVVHMSNVEKNVRKCTTNATSEKVEFFGSLTSQRPNLYLIPPWARAEYEKKTSWPRGSSLYQSSSKRNLPVPQDGSKWLKQEENTHDQHPKWR